MWCSNKRTNVAFFKAEEREVPALMVIFIHIFLLSCTLNNIHKLKLSSLQILRFDLTSLFVTSGQMQMFKP